jgi:hypothetical protein
MNQMARFVFKMFRGFLALLCMAFTLSCAHEKMYSGSTLPNDQLATLEATTPMWLVTVDGQHMSSFGLHDTVRVKILPGTHKVEVSYNSMENKTTMDRYGKFETARQETWSKKNFPITFTAKAGYRYVAHAGRIGASDWEPYITESLSETIKAGQK